MKLKNKENGIIHEVSFYESNAAISFLSLENGYRYFYGSLKDFNNEWEDASEEPKKHYEILGIGIVVECNNEEDDIFRCAKQREIGNDFETKEEAEKALEKLKAFTRLKGKGFRFIGKTYETDKRFGSIFYKVDDGTYSEDIIDDLDLLFGGEE